MTPPTNAPALLLSRGTVITMDPDRRVLTDGAVLVEGGRIAAVAPAAELEASHPAAKRLDAGGGLILPGMVNTHTHLFQGLLKGLGDDRPLYRWLREMTAPASISLTEEDCEAAALNGAVEAIRSGCTTLVDFMYVHPRPGLTDAVIRGLSRASIRAVVARGFVTQGIELGVPPALVEDVDSALADAERLIRLHRQPDALIHIGTAPCLLWMVDEAALCATRELTDQHGTLITYHLAETDFEVGYAQRTYGVPETDLLLRAGLLGPDLLAVHCTKLGQRDVRMLRASDVKVSHNPVSNMYLGAGVAPITDMLQAGMTVGLATDGPASNNNQNMIQVLKYAALLHKVSHEDATAMTAEKVLEMGTIDGARAIGLEDEIGSIEPGKKADIAVLSLDNPFIGPVHDPVSALVYAAVGSETRTVLIDGRVVMRDGVLTSLDEDDVRHRASVAAHGLAERAGLGGPRRAWRSVGY